MLGLPYIETSSFLDDFNRIPERVACGEWPSPSFPLPPNKSLRRTETVRYRKGKDLVKGFHAPQVFEPAVPLERLAPEFDLGEAAHGDLGFYVPGHWNTSGSSATHWGRNRVSCLGPRVSLFAIC